MTRYFRHRPGTVVRLVAPVVLLCWLTGALVAGGTTAASAAASPACAARPSPPGIDGVVESQAPVNCTDGATTGLVPHDDSEGASPSAYNGGDPPLLNGGGAVAGTLSTVGANTVHVLFWAPSGYAYPSGYEAGVDTYLDDVAAASGTIGNVYSVATQYTDGQVTGSPHIQYQVQVGAPIDDTDPFPVVGGCDPDSSFDEGYTACVTDDEMHDELQSVLSADSLPSGLGDIYLLVFPPNVETCADGQNGSQGGDCSDSEYPGFCAYHSASSELSSLTLYANIPYPTNFNYSCDTPESPNGSPALDSALSMISHEHNETITDPLGNAWIDKAGNEEADECAWNFGTALGGSPGAEWNQVINGDHYYLQEEFSNEDYALNVADGCTLSQDAPTASIAVTTSHPAAASATSFSGSGSSVANVPGGIDSWTWTFGDDSGAVTGETTAHTFASAGTYTVTLEVTDTDGFSASTDAEVDVGPPIAPAAPAFTTKSPPATATVGRSYHYTFAASGYPMPTFSLSGAPSWLTTSSSGAVSGTPPTGTKSFTFSEIATNGVAPAASVGPFRVTVSTGGVGATHGYWLVGSDGGIFSFGSAGFHGSTGSLALQRPVVGISPTSDRQGYWLVASDGGVFAFGDAGYYGSLPGLGFAPAGTPGPGPALSAPIVAIVPSTNDGGYFMVASDGGVFAFGDARFAGSCPGIGGCSGAAVAVMPDATGNGYWLVTVTGNVYAFGDAPFLGDAAAGSVPVTSAVRTPDGHGYWVLLADGGVEGFGNAATYGDPEGGLGTDTAAAVVATSDGHGYWVDTAGGGVYPYGDAPNDGSMAGAHLNAPIIAASGW